MLDMPDTRIRGRKWMRIRARVFRDEPLCRHCLEQGRVTVAQEVDHIIPLEDGGTNEATNLQPLCVPCHQRKSGYREKVQIGVDGWPVR